MKLIELLRGKRQAKSLTAWERYRELLARADAPKSGDEDALAKLLPELDLTVEDVERHGTIVAEYRSLQKKGDAAAVAAAGERSAAAERAMNDHRAEVDRQLSALRAVGDDLDAEVVAASTAHGMATSAAHRLGALASEHWRLLGLPDPSAEAMRRHIWAMIDGSPPAGGTYGLVELEQVMISPLVQYGDLTRFVFVPLPGQSQRACDELAEHALRVWGVANGTDLNAVGSATAVVRGTYLLRSPAELPDELRRLAIGVEDLTPPAFSKTKLIFVRAPSQSIGEFNDLVEQATKLRRSNYHGVPIDVTSSAHHAA